MIERGINDMKILKATLKDYKAIHEIVHNTIKQVYPNYYPTEVVEFFLEYHNEKNITSDVEKGNIYLLFEHDRYIATGSMVGSSVGRLYVLPEYQGSGYGSAIMDALEDIISVHYPTSNLEASLPSYEFYLKRGYQPKEYHRYPVENNRILCYYVMEKVLKPNNTC